MDNLPWIGPCPDFNELFRDPKVLLTIWLQDTFLYRILCMIVELFQGL